MGRGDKRTKKGKIFKGSYGKTRFRKKKLNKLRLKRRNVLAKPKPMIQEHKTDLRPKEVIEVKEEKIEQIKVVAVPVEVVEKPVEVIKHVESKPIEHKPLTSKTDEEKPVEKPKAKATAKPVKKEEKPEAKKRGRPKKAK